MRKKLNIRFLVAVLAGLVLLGLGGYGWHRFQLARNSRALLAAADRAEHEGRLEDATHCLSLYLAYNPQDTATLIRYGLLLDRIPDSHDATLKACGVLERAVSRAPQRDDLRRRLVHLEMDLHRPREAQQQLEILLHTLPEDGELEYLLGCCQEATGDYNQALQSFERARRHAPQQLESYVRAARLLRRLNEPDQADQILEALVTVNPRSYLAYLARGRFRREQGALEEWEKDVTRAQELAPDEAEVLLATAQLAQTHGEVDQARATLHHGLQRYPRQVALYQALAGLELEAGCPREAVACARQGLEVFPQQRDLLLVLAEALLQTGDLGETNSILEQLRRQGAPSRTLSYLDALVLMHQAQWLDAGRLLEQLQQQWAETPDRAGQADLALAQCYASLGQRDRQLAVCRRAVARNPAWPPARRALVSALLAAGRVDDALTEGRQVLTAAKIPPDAQLLRARLLVLHTQRLPAAARDWQEVEQALDEAARQPASAAAVAVLRAEILLARERPEEARALLDRAREQQPRNVELWLALIDLLEHQGQGQQARALLEQAPTDPGQRLEVELARARYWQQHPGSEAAGALATLEEDAGSLRPQEQARLLTTLALAYQASGKGAAVERLAAQALACQPGDLSTWLALIEVGRQTGQDTLLRSAADQVRKIEGEEGTLWRYAEAARLVQQARRGDRTGLTQARGLLEEVVRQRPGWGRALLLVAEVAELEGQPQRAIENYRQALEAGERQLGAARRLVQLLYETHRYAEADEVIRRLEQQHLVFGVLGQLGAEVALQTQEPERAVELARRSVSSDSSQYADHLWMGHVLWMAGKRQEAEAALRRAVKRGSQVGSVWVVLVRFLMQTGQREKAEQAVEEAQAQLPPAEAPLALAECLEAVGQLDRAEKQYQTALNANPHDPVTLRQAAAFYLRGNRSQEGEPLLRRLLDPQTKASPADAAWARRTLAVELAGSGSFPRFREALALLEQNRQDGSDPRADEAARALILATRPGRRQEAIHLLEELDQRGALTDQEQLLLARLYEANKDWPAARARLLGLVAARGDNRDYLAELVRDLLRHGEKEAAGPWFAKLEQAEPRALRTVELKARMLQAESKGEEVVALVRAAARADNAPVPALAALLEELGRPHEAEEMYRHWAERPDQPERSLVVAAFLGRQERFAEACALLDRAWQTCRPEEVAFTGVALLHNPRADAETFRRISQGLEAAREKHPEQILLALHLATLRRLQGRYPDAEALYRQILERDGQNVVALNNLAWLLAFRRDGAMEALTLIRRALAVAGPLPELLDTRAVVYLTLGQSQSAFKDLEESLADTPTAEGYFHLVRAGLLGGQRTVALEAWEHVLSVGLKPEMLHPLERPTYEQVRAEVTSP